MELWESLTGKVMDFLGGKRQVTHAANLREFVCAAYRLGGEIKTSHCTYGPTPFTANKDYGHMPYYRLLAGFARLMEARTIVEIGTYYGGSTLAFAAGLNSDPAARILTIDPNMHANLRMDEDPSIRRYQGNFPDVATLGFLDTELGSKRIDILYIDALKDQAFIKNALAAAARWHPKLVILDDISATDSMEAAWQELQLAQAHACKLSNILEGVRHSEFDFGILIRDSQMLEILADSVESLNGDTAFEKISVGGPYTFSLQDTFERVKTMMTRGETGMLNRLVRQNYLGLGQIVDAGAFLGGSTVAMGLALANRKMAPTQRIHSYDRFTNFDPYFDRFMDPPVERFQSYLPQYLRNIAPVNAFVNVYPGEFCQQRWCGKPIEIFFADIEKSPSLNAHLYAEFSRFWIPGHTVYIQQDFVHLEAPWIQYVIGYLSDYFSIIGVEAPSLYLGVRKTIPAAMIERIVADDFSVVEKVTLTNRLAERFPDAETRLALRLIAVRLMADGGSIEEAKAQLHILRNDDFLMSHSNSERRTLRTEELVAAAETRLQVG